MNYNVKIDLMKLRGARIEELGGRRCVCVPLDENSGPLEEDGGACILSLAAFELRIPKNGQTHLLKVALQRDQLFGMSADGRRSIPYIGNMIPWEKPAGSSVVRGRCMCCSFSEGARYAMGGNFVRCNHPGADWRTTRDIRYMASCPKKQSEKP